MTRDEREQSLSGARQGCHFLRLFIESQIVDGRIRQDIACLVTEFERLDAKEQAQIRAGKRYGRLGAEHGRKGGRPKKQPAEEEMERERIGKFTINYSPVLECATVTVQGILVPEVVHDEDGPDAVSKCRQWIAEQPADELNGGTK